ncbi:MAG: DinB family protein [Planctomycetota bacterium]|jgi:uncharacterized damage-inducible protein DinB
MSRLASVADQIRIARLYTKSLLDNLEANDWFRQPAEGVTHIAWQVGHLAAAEYYLTLLRIRGKREEDAALISDDDLKRFGKGSVPEADPGSYPSPEEIRGTFDRVHKQAVRELKELPETVLDERTDPPHPMFSTKLEALAFCSLHEMVHAGQIGLLRRLLGRAPLR